MLMVTELLLLLRGVSNTCITGMNQLVHSLLSATSSPGKTLPSRQLAGPMTGLRLLDSRKKKVLHNNSIRKMEQSEANSIHFFQWEKHAHGCTLYQVKLGNTSLGSQVLSSMSLLPEDAHHTDHTGNHC